MGSDATIYYTPGFMKIVTGIQKLKGWEVADTQIRMEVT
jgi:hypothetical protein